MVEGRNPSDTTPFDPSTGSNEPIVYQLADQETEKILHMWNADPLRDPTFTVFGNDDFYFQDYCVSGATSGPDCYQQNPEYDWNRRRRSGSHRLDLAGLGRTRRGSPRRR